MDNLNERGLVDLLTQEVIYHKKPFLGICLGLQMLFESSSESPGVKGLGILDGTVEKFSFDMGLKIPQIGWNSIETQQDMPLLGEFNGKYMYFVHSFYVAPVGIEEFTAKTVYGMEFASAVEYKNITACQFHPEKSGKAGLALLKKWTDLNL